MRASAGTLAFGLLISVAIPLSAAIAADPAEFLMLERANYWRQQHRPDIAGQILTKLLVANPGQPDALYQRGLLSLDGGSRGEAQQYFDRLRHLANFNPRAAALIAELMRSGTPPSAARAKTPLAAATAPPGSRAPGAVQPGSEFAVASVDSDDLVQDASQRPGAAAAAQAPRALTPGTTGGLARVQQLASLPAETIADSDVEIAATPVTATLSSASPTGSSNQAITVKPVQTAQLELMPPPPVGGYQRPANVTPYSPTDTLEMDIDRDLTLLQTQANPMLVAGLGFRWHDGTSGLNQLTEGGTPIEGSFSPWYTGTMRFSVLPVYLDAGTIGTGNLNLFGANPILTAKGLPLASEGGQHAGGVGLLGGYAYQDFSGQIGTSPLGFPVTNLVGSVAYNPKFLDNTLSFRIEGLRQPVTDSVLSYAGTHANLAVANTVTPNSFGNNPIWGGVVKTGGHVTGFYDDQMYGAYGGAGLASVTGMNVAENSQLDALLGVYFRPWKTDDWAIRAGVAGYYTSYNKNLAGFTFGQGGYFSPQEFVSVTFPVEYTGHSGPWSWLASVALGVQHFNSDSSPIFPKNAGAQTALANAGGLTTYSGTSATGLGASLKGQVEYAIDDSLSLGAAASFNNGNDYNEIIAQLYLRKTFDLFGPSAMRNDAQSIAARDQPMSHL